MGTGSWNGGNRRGVGGRRPARQLSARCEKFGGHLLKCHIYPSEADRRHRHSTGNTGTKIQGTGAKVHLSVARTRNGGSRRSRTQDEQLHPGPHCGHAVGGGALPPTLVVLCQRLQ